MDFNDRRMRAFVVPELHEGATRYAAERGQKRPQDYTRVVVNPEHARQMAAEYEAAPSREMAAEPHFRAMAKETSHQFHHLTSPVKRGGLGIEVHTSERDPYQNISELHQDITENRRMTVLSSKATGGHPFFTDAENEMFRAVHDAFGHLATGRGFDRHGEEAAFRSHASMYTPAAKPAMASETRGQNSTFIFGSSPGAFPEQKIAVVKSALITPPIGRRATLSKQLEEAVQMHAQYPVLGRSQKG